MQNATIATVELMLKADPDVTDDQARAIIGACRAPTIRRKLINARVACEILGVSRPTLARLASSGKLTVVRPTPRKTRFDLAEVERLAYAPAEARDGI
ncbi:MAG: helix-turn-helix domain-containing protein [Victivallaceae bacterium]|nr:helix-turn-helix domain-containing protein [Victivallaceae bacterium]